MRLYVYCEGPTEREFVKKVLHPFLMDRGIDTIPIVCTTSKNSIRTFKGGVSKFSKIKKELARLCGEHQHEAVTMMFDLYGVPHDTPGSDSGYNVETIEHEIGKEISCDNFIPYLSKYEFEALLFSDVGMFEKLYPGSSERLQSIRDKFDTPEDINSSQYTAPSKRIVSFIPEYEKVIGGVTISEHIGIEKMMDECPHFKNWIEKIISSSK